VSLSVCDTVAFPFFPAGGGATLGSVTTGAFHVRGFVVNIEGGNAEPFLGKNDGKAGLFISTSTL
jgi:hypothetical protein